MREEKRVECEEVKYVRVRVCERKMKYEKKKKGENRRNEGRNEVRLYR